LICTRLLEHLNLNFETLLKLEESASCSAHVTSSSPFSPVPSSPTLQFPASILRLLRYPTDETFIQQTQSTESQNKESDKEEMRRRVIPGILGHEHTDLGLVTLIPRSSSPGLQLLDTLGDWKWVNVENTTKESNRGTLLVIVGEQMAYLTSHYYTPVRHRILKPTGRGKPREGGDGAKERRREGTEQEQEQKQEQIEEEGVGAVERISFPFLQRVSPNAKLVRFKAKHPTCLLAKSLRNQIFDLQETTRKLLSTSSHLIRTLLDFTSPSISSSTSPSTPSFPRIRCILALLNFTSPSISSTSSSTLFFVIVVKSKLPSRGNFATIVRKLKGQAPLKFTKLEEWSFNDENRAQFAAFDYISVEEEAEEEEREEQGQNSEDTTIRRKQLSIRFIFVTRAWKEEVMRTNSEQARKARRIRYSLTSATSVFNQSYANKHFLFPDLYQEQTEGLS
jgi:hypothetical protein